MSARRPRPRRSRRLPLLAAATALMLLRLSAGTPPTVATAGDDEQTAAGSYVLSATATDGHYAPTFTGNGYIGVRVPPAGQGYSAGPPPAESTLAGFYAQAPGKVQQRADLPAWDTLRFGDGTGAVTRWRQRIDLHDGVITTAARRRAANGDVTDLAYRVFTDRARPHVAIVRLTFIPRWSGIATVDDVIDGTPATLSSGVTAGWEPSGRAQWETVRTAGLGIIAGLASRVEPSAGAADATDERLATGSAQSVGQQLRFDVAWGHTYTVTKYVGIATAGDAATAAAAARREADVAAATGYTTARSENAAAWRSLWTGRVDLLGNRELATEVNASEFYLWASTRDGVDWSIPPTGLSSNAYNGHVFWDAETWMFPALLAQHPDLAAGIDAYRLRRLGTAHANARASGRAGARFPWESALDGTEQTAPPAAYSEGRYEQHITADIALAQWQYYLATADRAWLAHAGWPVISGAAAFWASRATAGPHGSYHIDSDMGPDEKHGDVDDEVYTNVAAAATLRIAARAGSLVGEPVPPSWTAIARGLVVLYDPGTDLNPEFAGYGGDVVQQADATMLAYPWEYESSPSAALHDVDYYVPRTDPEGPSMSDAISSVDTSALDRPGCSAYTYTLRSIQPFVRDVFDQFSETTSGGAFTFVTAIGGLLQEFLYGYSGLRWSADAVRLRPSLTSQLGGIVLRDLAWHGSRFTVSIGRSRTTVSVHSGPAVPVDVDGTVHDVPAGGTLAIPTRRPDLAPGDDLARCRPATASSAQPGADALDAVDGSPATAWRPSEVASSITVPLAHEVLIGSVTLDWGQEYRGASGPNEPPPALTRRATAYDVAVSENGRDWMVVATVAGHNSGTRDVLTFPPVRARLVRVRIAAAARDTPPMLTELTVPGR